MILFLANCFKKSQLATPILATPILATPILATPILASSNIRYKYHFLYRNAGIKDSTNFPISHHKEEVWPELGRAWWSRPTSARVRPSSCLTSWSRPPELKEILSARPSQISGPDFRPRKERNKMKTTEKLNGFSFSYTRIHLNHMDILQLRNHTKPYFFLCTIIPCMMRHWKIYFKPDFDMFP